LLIILSDVEITTNRAMTSIVFAVSGRNDLVILDSLEVGKRRFYPAKGVCIANWTPADDITDREVIVHINFFKRECPSTII